MKNVSKTWNAQKLHKNILFQSHNSSIFCHNLLKNITQVRYANVESKHNVPKIDTYTLIHVEV